MRVSTFLPLLAALILPAVLAQEELSTVAVGSTEPIPDALAETGVSDAKLGFLGRRSAIQDRSTLTKRHYGVFTYVQLLAA